MVDPHGILHLLNGQHFKISGNQFSPYVFSRVKEDGSVTFAGVNHEIIRSASIKSNFTFDLDAPPGRGTGSKLANGTWDGIFAEVFYKRADLAIVLGHTFDRHELVDFTSPFGAANLIFATALPSIRVKPDAIVSSFSPLVWLCVALSLVGITLIVYATSWLRRHHHHQHRVYSVQTTVFYVFRILMDQEAGKIPGELRVISAMFLACVIIIGTGYKTNLLAALSFPRPDPVPNTFDQLAARADYEIYFDKSGTVGYNYFKQANSSTITNIRRRFEEHIIDGDPAKCVLASFMSSLAACIAWDTVLDEVMARNLSLKRGLVPLARSRQTLTYTWVTIGLQKNSKYTPAFNFISSSFYEAGLVSKWHKDIVSHSISEGLIWMKSQKEAAVHKALTATLENESACEARPLLLRNMYTVFAVCSLGMVVSLASFFGEILLVRRQHSACSPMSTPGGLRRSFCLHHHCHRHHPRLRESAVPSALSTPSSTALVSSCG